MTTYVLCHGARGGGWAWTRGREGWTTPDLPTHHHLHLSMPEETARILMENVSISQ